MHTADRIPGMLFTIGDYVAGAVIGSVTALVVRAVTWPGMDMVLGMLLGMILGMIVHLTLGFALAPLLGMFHTMMPGSLIGMYGGMFFGMRDSMAAGSKGWDAATLVGAIFGILVVLALGVYNRVLRGSEFDAGD